MSDAPLHPSQYPREPAYHPFEAPDGTIARIEIPLDGTDQLGTNLNWSDGADRINVKRVGQVSRLVGACLSADGGVATNFGATPDRDTTATLKLLSVIGNKPDPDSSNDLALLELTIEAGENYGPIVLAPQGADEVVTFGLLSALTASCGVAGGSDTPAVDLHKYYFSWLVANQVIGIASPQILVNPEGGASPASYDLGTISVTRDNTGLATFKAAAEAAGYVFPHLPVNSTMPPSLDPNQQPSAGQSSARFWWEVPTLGTADPGATQQGPNVGESLKSIQVRTHVGVPEQIGPPSAGVSIIVFLGEV